MAVASIPHFVWSKDKKVIDSHYSLCCKNDLPTILIAKHGKGYAYISYDSLSMFGGNLTKVFYQNKTVNAVLKFYKNYFKAFCVPEDKFQIAGGDNALGFVVVREHAEFIAEGLFHFLLTRK